MNRYCLAVLVVVFTTTAGSAFAQSSQWRYGGRVSWSNAGTTSEELGDTGDTLELKSGFGVEFDATLMFSDRFGVELSVGATAPRVHLSTDAGSIDGERVWLIPMTAIAQYHHPVYGPWDPYIGLGVTWVLPFYELSQDLEDAGVERLEFDGGPGPVAQLGANYQLDNRWYANIDLRYFGTTLDAQMRTGEGDLPTVELDVKPLVFSLGFGYKF